MRISTRLTWNSAGALATLFLLLPVLVFSFMSFGEAKADLLLATQLQDNFFERTSIRDHYLLYREERVRALWEQRKDVADELLREAQRRFPGSEEQTQLELLSRHLQDNAAVFRRIVENTARLEPRQESHAAYEELDRRLVSQLLLKAVAVREASVSLVKACDARISQAFQRLAILISLITTALAAITILTSVQIQRLVHRRLLPLHSGVKTVAQGNLGLQLECSGSDEFAELAQAFNAMTRKLQVSTRQLGEEISRRLVQAESQRTEARFRAWFELPLVGICITSPTCGWLEVNDHFCSMLGYAREDLARTTWAEVTHPADLDSDLAQFQRVMGGETEGYSLEKRFIRKDGGAFYAEIAVRCVRAASGTVDYFVALIQDISERKQAEAERESLQAQLHHSRKMESLGNLAGGVAHDMNNVLAAILGLASAHLPAQPEGSSIRGALQTIIKAAKRGGTMVKTLLSFARTSPAQEQVLDLNEIIREEARLLGATTLASVQLELDLAADLRPICGDGSTLSHALMNLCVNAVDAMPESGTLSLRTMNVDSAWVEVQVQDTGAGMTQAVLDKAMEPFFTTKGVGKGTGLGLSLAHSTVMAHQGQMQIRSEPGVGTCVSLRFPAGRTVGRPAVPVSTPGLVPQGKPLRVLLVDDDDLARIAIELVLQVLGHQAITVESGEEALSRLQAGFQPELVILDMDMPGLGGRGTLPQLRRLLPAVPILLATGRADQSALDLVEAYPGVTLLPKPFGIEELRTCLVRPRQGGKNPSAGLLGLT
jgi:PAS domain S-box-containing protein